MYCPQFGNKRPGNAHFYKKRIEGTKLQVRNTETQKKERDSSIICERLKMLEIRMREKEKVMKQEKNETGESGTGESGTKKETYALAYREGRKMGGNAKVKYSE